MQLVCIYGWRKLLALITMGLLLFSSASHAAPLIFEDQPSPPLQQYSNSVGSGPTALIRVSSPTAVNALGAAVVNNTSGLSVRFVIFNQTNSSYLYTSSAQSTSLDRPENGLGWVRSDDFPAVLLEPGNDYLIGIAYSVGSSWRTISVNNSPSYEQGAVAAYASEWWIENYASPTVVANPFIQAGAASAGRGLLRLYGPDLADLSITTSNGVNSVTAGEVTAYTHTVSNLGPGEVFGAQVTNSLPTQLINASWSCVGVDGGVCATASGVGDMDTAVDLPLDSSVIFTVHATVASSATGVLSNTATVNLPLDRADPYTHNNSSTDSDTIVQSGALSVSLAGPASNVTAGSNTGLSLTVSNAGPSDAVSVPVGSFLASQLDSVSWTCSGVEQGQCTAAGIGNISDSVNLPAGASVVYAINADVPMAVSGALDNHAEIAAPTGFSNTNAGNESSAFTLNVTAVAAATVVAVPSLNTLALVLLALGMLVLVAQQRRR